jgi:hypothetical protein
MRITTLLASIVALTSTAFAQNFHIPDALASQGPCNVIPFGNRVASATWENQRYQQMVTTADLGNKTVLNICELAFGACGSGNREFKTIEIKLGQTKATSLSTTFSANMVTNVQTVLSAKNYRWYNTNNHWNRLGLDKSYLYLSMNGNLVVEVTVTGAILRSTAGNGGMHSFSRQRLYRFGWTGTPPTTGTIGSTAALKIQVSAGMADVHRFGRSCKGSASNDPQLSFTGTGKLNTALGVNLSGARNTAPTLLAVNVSRLEPAIDLGVIGASGCTMYVQNAITIAGVTNTSGVFSLKATIPNNNALLCVRAYFQYFPFDRQANSLGITPSNYGCVLVGN